MTQTPSPSERVRASARLISSLPDSTVTVSESHCRHAAAFLTDHLAANPRTLHNISVSWRNANGLHPPHPTPSALNWIFLVDTLNFCFWGPPTGDRWRVIYRGNHYEGYWALCAAVNRALEEHIPLTDPAFYACVDKQTLAHIFRSANETPIPLLDRRVTVLNEAGKVLVDKFHGSVQKLIDSAQGSAQNLIQIVVDNFTSYDDVIPISNVVSRTQAGASEQLAAVEPAEPLRNLCFYKRAQILVADIWACFASTDHYSFPDSSSLTMFADYRVPQVLAWLRTITYSEELLQTMKRGDEIPSGDRREIEIRGCSIHAVELIRKEMERLAREKAKDHPSQGEQDHVIINPIIIDYALWDYGTKWKKDLAMIPIHRTKSVFY